MKFSLFLSAAILFSINVNGQVRRTSPPKPSQANAQQQETKDLQAEISRLQERITALESRVSLAELSIKGKAGKRDLIYLDLTSREFQRLDTDLGFFLISCENAEPYLGGYKIHLQIGNPSNASYAGYSFKVKWARTYDFDKYTDASYTEWQKTIQEKEISFTERLEPGTWNSAELILTPATAEQLGFLTLSMNTRSVVLRTR